MSCPRSLLRKKPKGSRADRTWDLQVTSHTLYQWALYYLCVGRRGKKHVRNHDRVDWMVRRSQHFSHITATAHIIHVFPGFHKYQAGALKCLVQGLSQGKRQRIRCGSNAGSLLGTKGEETCHNWVDWMVFNAAFNNISIISRQQLTLFMSFLDFTSTRLELYSVLSKDTSEKKTRKI